MQLLTGSLLVLCASVLFGSVNPALWKYKSDDGRPANWSDHFPNCGEIRQSPINFDTSIIKTDPNLKEILFVDYDDAPQNQTWQFKNNGHTVLLQTTFDVVPQIQMGGLRAKYELLQLHFHWGKDDFHGSEHRVDGLQYPLEMHIVHKRRADYTRHRFGPPANETTLAVIGVFFALSKDNSSNANLGKITDNLALVQEPDSTAFVQLDGFNLKELLPTGVDFFRYNGSLTTPPCDPIVQWSVFRDAVFLSSAQLNAFRNLRAHGPHATSQAGRDAENLVSIDENYRPVQPIANRQVLLYTSPKPQRTEFKLESRRLKGHAGTHRMAGGFSTVIVLIVLMESLLL